MPATIQQIVKPTRARGLDTSGNNNHAQIYSGRALEFDGAVDSLTVPDDVLEGKDWRTGTAAFWVYLEESPDASDRIFSSYTNSTTRFYLLLNSGGKIGYRFGDEGADTFSNLEMPIKTWHRVVIAWNVDGTANIYINGVLDKASTGIGVSTLNAISMGGSNNFSIGSHNGSSAFFMGMLSDFQMWNSTWTAEDAEYDYLNPEQLALNRGGTSLTNSNLKLWYPMNEGHRGDESYILDASNTGLGDELVTNGDFSDGLTGFTERNIGLGESADLSTEQVHSGTHSAKIVTLDNSSGLQLSTVLVEGQTYKVSAWFYVVSGDAMLNPSDAYALNSSKALTTTTGEWEYLSFYFTAKASTTSGNWLFLTDGNTDASTFYVDDVSVKAVNYKHNATTVFYGDNTISATNDKTMAGSNNWGAYGTGTTENVTDTAGKLTVTTTTANAVQGASLAVAHAGTPVVGRTYRIRAKLKRVSGLDPGTIVIYYGGALGNITTVGGGGTAGQITDSEVEYETTVTASSATGILLIANSANTTALVFEIDDVEIKEVGVASGWTDADQQLDIPQTALQSYNQLAFSDDYRSGISLSDGGTTTHQITTNSHTWSFWMFRNQEDSDTFHYVLQKGEYQESGYYIYQTGGKLTFVTNTSGANQFHATDATVPKGEWFHAAITVYSSGTASQWYINGEAESSVTGITAPVANTDYTSFYAYDSDNTTPPITHPGYQCLTELSSWNKKLSQDEIQEIYNDGLALDCTTHSASANLVGYWRNNGLAEWEDLSTNNYHGTPTSITETMLITAGADSSRDSQGFLMNRQRTTNSANIAVLAKQDGTNDEGSYIYLPDNPLYTGSAVTNYTISFWVKFAVNPTDLDHSMHFIDTNQSNANRTFKIHITSGGIIYFYTYYDSSAGTNSVYCDYGFTSKLGNAIQTPPTGTNAGIGEAFDVNNWYHLTWTFDHDRTTGSGTADNTNATGDADSNFTPYKMYINGICVAVEGREGTNSAMTTARSMQAANTPVMIGTAIGSSTIPETGSQKDFKGQIDDICFYSDTLEDEEVLRNYNAGKRSHR